MDHLTRDPGGHELLTRAVITCLGRAARPGPTPFGHPLMVGANRPRGKPAAAAPSLLHSPLLIFTLISLTLGLRLLSSLIVGWWAR